MTEHYYLVEESQLRTILAGYFENNEYPDAYTRAKDTLDKGVYLPCPDHIAQQLLNAAYTRKWGKKNETVYFE